MISRIILIQNDRSILKYISFQNREALTRDCGKFLGQINFPHFEQRSKNYYFRKLLSGREKTFQQLFL